MKQMTIRAMDPELEQGINAMAKERDWSVNQVATYLMRRGLGLTDQVKPQMIGNQLDDFLGRWTPQESERFDQETERAFGQIDDEHWQ
ncbi:MAG: hypothetical protein AAGH72_12705 [Verrucomicrobiota bacterium]